MYNPIYKGICFFALASFCHSTFAINFQKYVNNLQTHQADDSARSTLLGIIGSCGNSTNLDDECMVSSLERVSTEENIAEAKSILQDYETALNEGQNMPECQTESHFQANRTVGHCILLMNYYALENNDKDSAVAQYETCLQGGMMGLAYQGNIVAQYMLSEIFKEKGQPEQAFIWKNSLKTRKGSDEYQLLLKCYGS